MFADLPEIFLKDSKTQLALAIAQGESISMWARQNEVSRSTAYRWASEPSVRRMVDLSRRHALDQAIGRMAKRAAWATDQIATLAKNAESESVKLRALQWILSDVRAGSKFSELESRMTEMEEELRDRIDSPDVSGWR